jgi:hypothetical protein
VGIGFFSVPTSDFQHVLPHEYREEFTIQVISKMVQLQIHDSCCTIIFISPCIVEISKIPTRSEDFFYICYPLLFADVNEKLSLSA